MSRTHDNSTAAPGAARPSSAAAPVSGRPLGLRLDGPHGLSGETRTAASTAGDLLTNGAEAASGLPAPDDNLFDQLAVRWQDLRRREETLAKQLAAFDQEQRQFRWSVEREQADLAEQQQILADQQRTFRLQVEDWTAERTQQESQLVRQAEQHAAARQHLEATRTEELREAQATIAELKSQVEVARQSALKAAFPAPGATSAATELSGRQLQFHNSHLERVRKQVDADRQQLAVDRQVHLAAIARERDRQSRQAGQLRRYRDRLEVRAESIARMEALEQEAARIVAGLRSRQFDTDELLTRSPIPALQELAQLLGDEVGRLTALEQGRRAQIERIRGDLETLYREVLSTQLAAIESPPAEALPVAVDAARRRVEKWFELRREQLIAETAEHLAAREQLARELAQLTTVAGQLDVAIQAWRAALLTTLEQLQSVGRDGGGHGNGIDWPVTRLKWLGEKFAAEQAIRQLLDELETASPTNP